MAVLMYSLSRHREKPAGFTLLELSVSIGIIALMLSGTLTVMSDFAVKQESLRTKDDLKVISDALVAYKDRNGRLPCPASQTTVYGAVSYGRQVNSGDCTYTVAPAGTTRTETAVSSGKWVLSGAVPVRDLLLRDSFMKDKFGNRYTYVVPQVLTDASTFSSGEAVINVKRSTGDNITQDGAFALVSHGIDGKGAYREASGNLKLECGSGNSLDVTNCTPGATIMDAAFNDGRVEESYFDDTVLWKSKVALAAPAPASVVIVPDFTGFRIDGPAANSQTPYGLAAGDINGDGFEDVIIGSPPANSWKGEVYIVFGDASGIPTPLDLSTPLDGTNGFLLQGSADWGRVGWAVSAGDVNGDEIDDIIIGAWYADSAKGHTYVVFGKTSGWAASASLASLDGATGFVLVGTSANDGSGMSVRSGDINGDNFDDVIIGAPATGIGGAGLSYVVFGKSSGWSPSKLLSSLDGSDGFRLDGTTANDWSGEAVSSGDVNGDGFDDVIVGAVRAESYSGHIYVIFGKATGWTATIALSSLNGTNGFKLVGPPGSGSGDDVGSGDINGDGFDDIIVGAPYDGDGAFVVFGKSGSWAVTTSLASLNGSTGFKLDGPYYTGYAVTSGNINGDGFDDVIVSAYNSNSAAGFTYVYFGKASGWTASIDLTTLTGNDGFRLDGVNTTDISGYSLTAGDISGDGNDDLLIGAIYADNNSRNNSGSTYGVYGKPSGWSATYNLDTLTVP